MVGETLLDGLCLAGEIGWQFVLADYVAGLVLIALLAVTFKYLVPDGWFEAAREHLRTADGVRDPSCGMGVDPTSADVCTLETDGGTEYFCSESCKQASVEQQRQDAAGWRERLLTRDGWRLASKNALGEWGMLRKDILAGFLIAGLIGAFVPRAWWTRLFGLGAEGTLTWVVASAVIGVVIGVVTFVCSVGNVPFAVIHDAWSGLGLVPPQGRAGGTAPSGYAASLNAAFTLVLLGQLRRLLGDERRTSDGPRHAHRMTTGRSHRDRYH